MVIISYTILHKTSCMIVGVVQISATSNIKKRNSHTARRGVKESGNKYINYVPTQK